MGRTVVVPIDGILNLVVCAEEYGLDNEILLLALMDWATPVTDEDVDNYCRQVAETPIYGEGRAPVVRLWINTWRERYGAGG